MSLLSLFLSLSTSLFKQSNNDHPNMNMEPTTSMAMPAMSMMDHADHGGHGGHDMPMGPKCSMNMLWHDSEYLFAMAAC
jgi:hypothetical protein